MKTFALSVDIGGTFTDFVLVDRKRKLIHSEKALTTPERPEIAILQGIDLLEQKCGLRLPDADLFLHATTLITNALLERKGCDFIGVFTAGFSDLLEIGKETRYDLTDLKLSFPEPVSKRAMRLEVDERISSRGAIVKAPAKAAFLAQVRELLEQHPVTSFAVCLLNSYVNDAHETQLAAWLRELVPGAHVSRSSDIAATQGEFERWTSCTVNAYTMPLLAEYVKRLETALLARGYRGAAMLMTSSGVPASFGACMHYPIRLIESGPAAGVLAAQDVGSGLPELADSPSRRNDILAFDMGGTTAKGAFLVAGEFKLETSLEIARVGNLKPGSGLRIMIPAIELIEIGVGGGSIARIDARGLLAVGPLSAGAVPGPAAYSKGGKRPTLTDANVAIGLLGVENFAGSGIFASRRLAEEAIATDLVGPLHSDVIRVAHGIRNTVHEDVARAFRVHAAESGIDYRKFTLVCTGGSAPLHAAEVARLLNLKRLVFPFAAGVRSAMGLLVARTGVAAQSSKTVPLSELSRHLDALDSDLAFPTPVGFENLELKIVLGVRYRGQGHHLDLQFADIAGVTPDHVKRVFSAEYLRVFGTSFPESEVEVVSIARRLLSRQKICDLSRYGYARADFTGPELKGNRLVSLVQTGEAEPIPVFNRYAMKPGFSIAGPALIEERETTIYLPRGVHAEVLESLDILAELGTNPGLQEACS